MKSSVFLWQIAAMIFSIILGTILHFVYEWSGQNQLVASFSAVNESVWEHLKLTFFPMLIFAIIEYFFVKDVTNNYIIAKFIAIVFAIGFIIIFFYTYTGILGKNYFLLDILSFVVAIIVGELLAYQIMLLPTIENPFLNLLAIIGIVGILLAFIIFTYIPPKINLFKDSVTKKYGINVVI